MDLFGGRAPNLLCGSCSVPASRDSLRKPRSHEFLRSVSPLISKSLNRVAARCARHGDTRMEATSVRPKFDSDKPFLLPKDGRENLVAHIDSEARESWEARAR